MFDKPLGYTYCTLVTSYTNLTLVCLPVNPTGCSEYIVISHRRGNWPESGAPLNMGPSGISYHHNLLNLQC